MQKWWLANRHKLPLELRNEDRAEMEGILGNLPILLNVLLYVKLDNKEDEDPMDYDQQLSQIHDKLKDSQQVKEMVANILVFAERQSKKLRDTLELLVYRKALGACLTENDIAESAEDLLNWRHFYVEEGVGKSTCGIARKVAAGFLQQVSAGSTFLTPKWYNSLRLAGPNPSVLGFFTEQMILSWISQVGCPDLGPSFARPSRVVVFSGKLPKISLDIGFSLYIPTAFNFQAVDAIMVFRLTTPGQRRLWLACKSRCLQAILIRRPPPFRTGNGGNRWLIVQWWQSVVDCPKVSFGFLWVLEETTGKVEMEEIPMGERTLRGVKKVWHPPFTRVHISVENISKDIGAKLRAARANHALNDELPISRRFL
ncbi:hypothetical protein BGX38DRAFT_418374 [Terfezia claveryi]|nr:hypothetical protein BGX38DRAFT_418374 [Terfezia claveryi]